jgi:hypothetical protein
MHATVVRVWRKYGSYPIANIRSEFWSADRALRLNLLESVWRQKFDCVDSLIVEILQMKKAKLDPSCYQQLLADQFDLLRHAFESFLVWERFGDLIRDTRVGAAEYPRVHVFQPITLAFVASAFDSFVVNLYKFHDRRSNTLETLLDVGIRAGKIEPELERILASRIAEVKAMAAKLNIRTLRNSSVGHYNATVEKRSPLTTVRPEPKEIRR